MESPHASAGGYSLFRLVQTGGNTVGLGLAVDCAPDAGSQISGLSEVSLWGLWVVNGLHLGGVLRPVMMEGMCYAGCGCCMVLSLWSCVGQFL